MLLVRSKDKAVQDEILIFYPIRTSLFQPYLDFLKLVRLSQQHIGILNCSHQKIEAILANISPLLVNQSNALTFASQKGPIRALCTIHHEVNSRTDSNLPLLPQPPQRARTGSQRCVQAEKSRYYTSFASSIDIHKRGLQVTKYPLLRTWALQRYIYIYSLTQSPPLYKFLVLSYMDMAEQAYTIGPRCNRLHRQRHHRPL